MLKTWNFRFGHKIVAINKGTPNLSSDFKRTNSMKTFGSIQITFLAWDCSLSEYKK